MFLLTLIDGEFFIKDTINPSQLFVFTNVIRFSRLPLRVGCFIYFKFTREFNSLSITTSLVQFQETNW